MRGLFGVVSPGSTAAPACLRAMLDRLPDEPGPARVEFEDAPDGSWALARVHLGVIEPNRQLPGSGALRVLLHGDLTPAGATPGRKEKLRDRHASSLGAWAVEEGAYVAVVLDAAARRVHLISDAVGAYPLYWAVWRGMLLFAPSVQAVLRGMGTPPDVDRSAVAEYLHYGFVLGTRTLDSRVRLLGPGSVLQWEWGAPQAREDRVKHTAAWFGGWSGSRSSYTEAVRLAFNDAVTRAAATDAPLAMSLSGGLDSRAILSALPPGTAATYTVGVRRCADDDIARRLAALGRTRHIFVELGQDDLRDFLPNLERIVRLSDGFYLSHGLTEMAALEAVRRGATGMLLRGHCGELLKASLAWPLHTDRAIFQMRTATEVASYLSERVNYVTQGDAVERVFSERWARDIDGVATASLHQSVAGLDIHPADVCSYLYLHEHHRRFTVPSLELFRSETEVRLPFADERFLKVLLSGAPEWRDGTHLHKHITATNNARMLAVRNSNTGAPGNASPLLERVLDPVNSVLKRLNAPGFRHYHNYEAWMQSELTTSVEQVLLSPESLDRGMLRREGLVRVIEQTRSGVVNHGYLLQILLTLELWQRQAAPASNRGRSAGANSPS